MRDLFHVALAAPALGAALLAAAPADGGEARNNCVECHRGLDDEDMSGPVSAFEAGVHSRHGVSCSDCHGGDPSLPFEDEDDGDAAMDEENGFQGSPARDSIPGFCGRCHADIELMRRHNPQLPTDQLRHYETSQHGKGLARGDKRVAVCTDCHGVHGILPASDPASPVYPLKVPFTCARCHGDAEKMKPYGLPTDQLERYARSAHGRRLLEHSDTGAPACNDCHGNHGAVPPGAANVQLVCGQCHSAQYDIYRKSAHARFWPGKGLGACAECHGNHEIPTPTDAMLGVSEGSVCVRCHDKEGPARKAAAAMAADLSLVRERFAKAADLVSSIEAKGLPVGRAYMALADARSAIVRSRVEIHAFDPAGVRKLAATAVAAVDKAEQHGRDALDELTVRRLGLAGASVVLFVLVALLLARIRQLNLRRREEEAAEKEEA